MEAGVAGARKFNGRSIPLGVMAFFLLGWVVTMLDVVERGDGATPSESQRLVFCGLVAGLAWVVLVLGGVVFWWGQPVWPWTLVYFGVLAFPFVFIVWPVILGTLAWGGFRTCQTRRART